MMHTSHRWPYHQPSSSAYGMDDEDAVVASAADDDDFFDDVGGGGNAASRRYLTAQPKHWSTSYVGTSRQHYVHSTADLATLHNGGFGGGLEHDVYGRSSTDFFPSKTMPKRMTGAATDERHGRDSATTEAVQQQGTGGSDRHHWPPVVPSADIAAYPLQGRPPGRRAADKATVGSTSAAYGRGSKSAGPCQWKTRALYAFLAGLLAVVIINLTLTLWFIRVTKFTTEGLGTMKIVQGGLKLSGRTLVTDRLVVSAIRSRAGRPILIESAANITLNARNSQGRLLNSLKLTKDGLECAQANVFRVTDTRGEILFSADRSKVIVGAQELHVTGSGGAVFQGSVQTPIVRADPRHDLRLESASRKLELSGPQGVTIESRAGDISVSCLMDVKLQSIAGAIQIDAAKVFLRGLKTVKTSTNPGVPSATGSVPAAAAADDGGWVAGRKNPIGAQGSAAKKRGVEDKLPSVYQLCVCGNGKVFMSPPDGQCAADNESLVCR